MLDWDSSEMQQLVLDIGPAAEPDFDNFVAGPNAEALARVRSLAAGSLREAIVYLWGEPGSGRTHLLRAAARVNPQLVIADDVESLDAGGAAAAFRRDQRRARRRARRCSPPAAPRPAGLALREDLRTRLAWGLVYQLRPLERRREGRSTCAPRPRAAACGCPDEVVGYLLTRLPRDLPSLNGVLDALDRYSLAAKRPVTLPLVREALEKKR